jgi:NADH:quinone reductase (non-electrogenic)
MATEQYEHQVVVLGAGYTGLMAALRVARKGRRLGAKVVLVNPSDRFVERLRMHQIAAGEELEHYSISEMVADTGIEFVRGFATRIAPELQNVVVEENGGRRVVPYDYLVYAIGSGANIRTVPGADLHAYTLDSPQSARRFARRLTDLQDHGAVAVCGNGLTGIEAAAEVAESFPSLHVSLIGREEPGVMMGPKARRYLHATLERLGIDVLTGATVTKVLPEAVELNSDGAVPTDVCLWTTGFWASDLAKTAAVQVDDRDRIIVDGSLRSVSHPQIFAVGDAAAVRQPWGEIHGTCQSGIPTAVHAADSCIRLIKNKNPKRFRFGYIHQPVSLGRKDGVIQFAKPDDTPRKLYLKGKRAARYKEFVSSSPPKFYRLARRFPIPRALVVPKGGRATRRNRVPAAVS